MKLTGCCVVFAISVFIVVAAVENNDLQQSIDVSQISRWRSESTSRARHLGVKEETKQIGCQLFLKRALGSSHLDQKLGEIPRAKLQFEWLASRLASQAGPRALIGYLNDCGNLLMGRDWLNADALDKRLANLQIQAKQIESEVANIEAQLTVYNGNADAPKEEQQKSLACPDILESLRRELTEARETIQKQEAELKEKYRCYSCGRCNCESCRRTSGG